MADVTTPESDNVEISVWQGIMKPPQFSTIRSAARQRQANIEKRMEKNFHLELKLQEAMRGRKTYEEVRSVIKHSNVVLKVKKQNPAAPGSEQELQQQQDEENVDISVSYRQQGNIDMYTSENMKKREQNKYDPGVSKALDEFWQTMPRTTNETINKSIYKWMARKLYFAFVPHGTETEFNRTVEEDWRNDAVWTHSMTERMFRNAMFALADVWCETTDPSEYKDFLQNANGIVKQPPEYNGSRTDPANPIEEEDRSKPKVVLKRKGQGSDVKLKRVTSPTPFVPQMQIKQLPPMPDHRGAEDPCEVNNPDMQLELLEQEIFDACSGAWFTILRAFCEWEGANAEKDDDYLQFSVRQLQDERYEMTKDDNDPSFDLEHKLLDVIRRSTGERGDLRAKLVERLICENRSEMKRTVEDRRNERLTLQHRFTMEYDALFTDIRSLTFNQNLAAANIHKQFYTLQKQTLQLAMEKEWSIDKDVVALTNVKMRDIERHGAVRTELSDDFFADFVQLSRDLQEARMIQQRAQDDSLGSEMYDKLRLPGLGGGADGAVCLHTLIPMIDEPAFGSEKWVVLCEWLTRQITRYNETIEASIDGVRENLYRINTVEKKFLTKIQRLQMEYETEKLSVCAADTTLPSHRQLALMQKFKEEKDKHHAERSVQNKVIDEKQKEMLAFFNDFAKQLKEKIELDKKVIGALPACKSMDEAYETLKPLLVFLADIDAPDTNAIVGESSILPVAGSAVNMVAKESSISLPETVKTTLDFMQFAKHNEAAFFDQAFFGLQVTRMKGTLERFMRSVEIETAHRRHLSLEEAALFETRLATIAAIKEDPASSSSPEGKRRIEQEGKEESELKRVKEEQAYNDERGVADKEVAMDHVTKQTMMLVKLFDQEMENRTRIRTLQKVHFDATRNVAVARIQGNAAVIAQQTGQSGTDPTSPRSMTTPRETAVLEQARKQRQDEQRRMLEEQHRRAKQQEELEGKRLAALESAARDAEDRRKRKEEGDKRRLERQRQDLQRREKLEKERIQQEREERKKWHDDFIEEEKKRKKAEMERQHEEKMRFERSRTRAMEKDETAAKQQRKGGTKTTPVQENLLPPISPTAAQKKRSSVPKSASYRRVPGSSTPKGDSSFAPQLVVTTTPNASSLGNKRGESGTKSMRKSQAPSAKVRAAMENEIKNFQQLNTVSMAVNMENFADRRQDYLLERVSTVDMYAMECARLRHPINPSVSAMLSSKELSFHMTRLDVNNCSANVLTLFDVLLMNPVQHLCLQRSKMDADITRKLCQTILAHPFIAFLDVRHNPEIGVHGGHSLLTLVKTNTRIVRVRCNEGSNIPADVVKQIEQQTEHNKDARNIGRTEFEVITKVFQQVDADHSGLVDFNELSTYNKKNQALRGTVSMANFEQDSVASSDTLSLIEVTLSKHQDKVRDALLSIETEAEPGTTFSLSELLTFVYPGLTLDEADEIVAKFTDDTSAGPNAKEMQQFMDTYGKHGRLTLKQLAQGLDEDGEALRTAFQECDVDNDGFLSLEEFIQFVGA